MEKLALGLTLLCLLYLVIFFGMAYWLDHWSWEKEEGERKMSIKEQFKWVLRKWASQFQRDQSKNAA